MRTSNRLWNKAVAVLLCISMVVPMLPALSLAASDEPTCVEKNTMGTGKSVTPSEPADDERTFLRTKQTENGKSYYRYTKRNNFQDDGTYGNKSGDAAFNIEPANSSYITFDMAGASKDLPEAHTLSEAPVIAIKYRTGGLNNGAANGQPWIVLRCESETNGYVKLPQDGYGSSEFKTVIVDLSTDLVKAPVSGSSKGITSTSQNKNKWQYITLEFKLIEGQWVDIEYVATFENVEYARLLQSEWTNIVTTSQKKGRTNVLAGNTNSVMMGKEGEVSTFDDTKKTRLTDGDITNNASGEVSCKYWDGGQTLETYPAKNTLIDGVAWGAKNTSYRPKNQDVGTNTLNVDGANKQYWYTIQFTLDEAKSVNGFTVYAQGYKKYVMDRAFDILVSTDGTHWKTAYSMDLEPADKNDIVSNAKYCEYYHNLDVSASVNAAGSADDGVAYVTEDFYYVFSDVNYIMYACDDYRFLSGHYTMRFTEIEVYEASDVVTVDGFQNGGTTGYRGEVDSEKPVTYQFTVTNDGQQYGQQKLTDISLDTAVGASFSKDAVSLNAATNFSDLRVLALNGDTVKAEISGNVIKTWTYGDTITDANGDGNVVDDAIRYLLEVGLDPGESIQIYGIKYKAKSNEWGNVNGTSNSFQNKVSVTALSGDAEAYTWSDWIVHKAVYVYDNIHRYEWLSHGVSIDKSAIVEIVNKKVGAGTVDTSSAFQSCSPDGTVTTDNRVVIASGSSGKITFTGTKTGSDSFFVKVGNYGPVRIDVYTYDVGNDAFVLDYGLPVTVNTDDLIKNDTISVDLNPNTTSVSMRQMCESATAEDHTRQAEITRTYGTFTKPEGEAKITYTPTSFMSGTTDTVGVGIRVMENGADEFVNNVNGIVMYSELTFVPANIVYYEDDFGALTFFDNGNTEWEQKGSSTGTSQDADQTTPYGSDPNYALSKEPVEISSGRSIDASNGVVHYLSKTEETTDVMSFTFVGTGFQLISAVSKVNFPVLMIKVFEHDTDNLVKFQPVIAENRSEDLYQIPLVEITGLKHGKYDVSVSSSASTDEKNCREVIIDGVRIYDPLADDVAGQYYAEQENGAKRYNVRSLILDEDSSNTINYIDCSDGDASVYNNNGSALVEDFENGGSRLKVTDNKDAYKLQGPNNEIYLGAGDGTLISALAFYAIPDGDDNGTIQVGVHRKDGSGSIKLVYASTAVDLFNKVNSVDVASGTEQYVNIDLSKLTPKDGAYSIFVGVCGQEASTDAAVLSITNIKLKGYTLSADEPETALSMASSVAKNSTLAQIYSVGLLAKKAAETVTENINEDLYLYSAELVKNNNGETAVLTVTASTNAVGMRVTASDGTDVRLFDEMSDYSGATVTLTAVVPVKDIDQLFNVTVYDKDGKTAVSSETVTVSSGE